MLDSLNISPISEAAKAVVTQEGAKPSPESVVEALLAAEKSSKKNKDKYSIDRLFGSWRLCFITGTKKTRAKAGTVLGAGKYVPNWVKITITYQKSAEFEVGKVDNLVEFGPFKLCVSGPIKLIPNTNILAFDFTRMIVSIFGLKLYSGYIREGKKSEDRFYQTALKDLEVFFVYFLVTDDCIAARGRGGGLAIWGKDTK
ncbi:MAG: hypothetical protein QNJ38_12100 [Prochloraceae cyanobacterium]|nr:hypothetical protein [Prochloraceae cyanobacterium]